MSPIELGAQALEAALHARADRRHGGARAAGHLARGKVLEEAEQHRRAVGLVEREDRVHHAPVPLRLRDHVEGGRPGLGARDQALARIAASVGAPALRGGPPQDRGHPAARRVRRGALVRERGDPRVLGEVVGRGIVAHQGARDPADPGALGQQGGHGERQVGGIGHGLTLRVPVAGGNDAGEFRGAARDRRDGQPFSRQIAKLRHEAKPTHAR